jgi:hypothetical protein
MPKLCCTCGFVHDLSPIPDDGWITVRDREYESLTEAERVTYAISGGNSLPNDNDPRVREYDEAIARIASITGLLYECPACGTIMWKKPGCDDFRVYTPET